MKLSELQSILEKHPETFPRFILPDGDLIPAHAHITEVALVVRQFVDCGGVTGREKKIVLQTHVGSDIDHRLSSDRFAEILRLGNPVIRSAELDVEVEYDCCVVSQYPVTEAKPSEEYLDLVLKRGATQCRPSERRKTQAANTCCSTAAACC